MDSYRFGAGRYIQESNALDYCGEEIKRYGKKAYVIGGNTAIAVTEKRLCSSFEKYGLAYCMTNFQLVTRIVIPQAVRIALPPLFNDVINLIKMTSLAFMLGVPDVMGAAKIEGARTFRYFEIYAAVMLIYWVIIFVLGILHKLLEKKCASMY